ncbi:Stealth protein CR1, conserved region 1 [Lutibacter agarilyticus]|uniref:Stealth protein CR1, conserved region 1 n=1 Tax=Lutibacter agarilyticus TaxID=1109740 RepID=A0A238WVK2_9FLAO|nr:Stealth CR1 domain-containing protein [Lutibacter agarilyticus]SNR50595.1 Stealth protein CR1, conserved region 1 [Lutibacter agarilyticus]
MNKDFPIDIVIPWVDGNERKLKEKMKLYVENKELFESKNFRTRFDQVEEIKFSIDSILKFAPYIRTIFLVTDSQVPNFLIEGIRTEKYSKVKIIDHKVIFKGYEKYLPTFNCLPIETMLTKIPNLAEHFIYFNDDFFLIKETKPSDFFVNSTPVLRGKWKQFNNKVWYKIVYSKLLNLLGEKHKNEIWGFKKGQQIIAHKLGFKKYFKFDHTPAPIRKSTLENYFSKNPEMRDLNIKHRFRHPEQFTFQGLANHIEIKNKTCVIKYNYQLEYFGSYKKPFLWYKFVLWLTNKNSSKLFLCLQSLDQCSPNKLNYFRKWFAKTFEN